MKEPIKHGGFLGSGDEGHPDADQIAAFLESALPAHERDAMLTHLAVCRACRAAVALSLPQEESPSPHPAAKPRPWFAGWGLAWPAGAALALVLALAVYVRQQVVLRHARPAPVEIAHAPEAPEIADQPLALGAARAIESRPKDRDEKKRVRPSRPGPLTNQAVPEGQKRADLGAARAPGSPANQSAAPAPAQAQTNALAVVEEPAPGFEAVQGVRALKKTDAVLAALHLPSGLPILSMAERGSQILAIDNAHGVYRSPDRGEHWILVPASWTGRAVKADLVRFAGAMAPESARRAALIRQRAVTPSQRVAAAASEAVLSPEQVSGDMSAAFSPAQDEKAASAGDQLTGIVTDRQGAAIPGATVTLHDAKDGNPRTAITGQDGGYLLEGVRPGTYDLETEARGFERQRTSPVEVRDARLNVQNVTLNLGAATETVTVDASAPVPATEAVTLAATVSAKAQATPAPPPVFAITTDRGEQWTSVDGVTWKRN